MAASKPPLSPADTFAIVAVIGGALATGLPVVALTRALILLFALGGALYLCFHLAWRPWKRWLAAGIAVAAYIGVVLLLFEREARETNTIAPTTVFVRWLLNHFASIPWGWVLASAAIAATAVWLVVRRQLQPRPDASAPLLEEDLSLAERRLRDIVRNDKLEIGGLVRLAGISYQPDFVKAHIDFVFSIFNMSIYDIAIDNKIKAGPIRFGEDWESFHYEPKITSDEPILCKARSGNFFIVRQPIRLEEIERFKKTEFIIGLYDLHVDFRGTDDFPEIETTRLDFEQRYVDTKKRVVRFLERLEQVFMFTEEQWKALKNQDEIDALRHQIKALEVRKGQQGLRFEIDPEATQVKTSGGGEDSRRVQADVQLRCSKIGDSKLAIREFSAALFSIDEKGEVEIARNGSQVAYSYPDMKLVETRDGWTVEEPLTPYRWYMFFLDVEKKILSQLTPRNSFFRVTMNAIGQEPQHVDFFVDSWSDVVDSNSRITLRGAD